MCPRQLEDIEEVNRLLNKPLPGKIFVTAPPLTDVTTLGSPAADKVAGGSPLTEDQVAGMPPLLEDQAAAHRADVDRAAAEEAGVKSDAAEKADAERAAAEEADVKSNAADIQIKDEKPPAGTQGSVRTCRQVTAGTSPPALQDSDGEAEVKDLWRTPSFSTTPDLHSRPLKSPASLSSAGLSSRAPPQRGSPDKSQQGEHRFPVSSPSLLAPYVNNSRPH